MQHMYLLKWCFYHLLSSLEIFALSAEVRVLQKLCSCQPVQRHQKVLLHVLCQEVLIMHEI